MHVDIPTLGTKRLALVPPHLSHLSTYETLYGKPEVMRQIAEPLERSAALKLLAAHAESWVLHGYGSWCVQELASLRFIGIAGLKCGEQPADVEVGWIIEPSLWGRGYATEVAEAVTRYAFASVGAEQVTAQINAENTGSIAVAIKLGMKLCQASSSGPTLVFVLPREQALEA